MVDTQNGVEQTLTITPAQDDGKFTMVELQGYVSGYVACFPIEGRVFVVDEDAALRGKPYNKAASLTCGIGPLFGNVLVCTPQEAAIMVFPDDDEALYMLVDETQQEEIGGEYSTLDEAKDAAREAAWINRRTVCVEHVNTSEIVYTAHFVLNKDGFAIYRVTFTSDVTEHVRREHRLWAEDRLALREMTYSIQ